MRNCHPEQEKEFRGRYALGNGSGMARVLSRITPMIPDYDPITDSDASSVNNDAENDDGHDDGNDNRHTMPEVGTMPPIGSCGKYTAKMKNVQQK